MENLLLFDELALDHARTVVFTVCAKQTGETQASRIRLLKINCFMAWHIEFSHYKDNLVFMTW